MAITVNGQNVTQILVAGNEVKIAEQNGTAFFNNFKEDTFIQRKNGKADSATSGNVLLSNSINAFRLRTQTSESYWSAIDAKVDAIIYFSPSLYYTVRHHCTDAFGVTPSVHTTIYIYKNGTQIYKSETLVKDLYSTIRIMNSNFDWRMTDADNFKLYGESYDLNYWVENTPLNSISYYKDGYPKLYYNVPSGNSLGGQTEYWISTVSFI